MQLVFIFVCYVSSLFRPTINSAAKAIIFTLFLLTYDISSVMNLP